MIDFDIKKPRNSTVNRPFGSPDTILPQTVEQDLADMYSGNTVNISFMPRVHSNRNRIWFYFGQWHAVSTNKDFYFYFNESEGEGEWLRRIFRLPDETLINEGYVGATDGSDTFYFTTVIATGGLPSRRTRLVTWVSANKGLSWAIAYDRDVSSMAIPGATGITEVNGFAQFVTSKGVIVIAHLSNLNEVAIRSRLVAWKDQNLFFDFGVPNDGLITSPGVRARDFDPETETGFFQYHDDFNNTIDTWYYDGSSFSEPVESFTGVSVPAAVDMKWFPKKDFLILSTLATGPPVQVVDPVTMQPVFTSETFFRVGIIYSPDGGRNLFSTDRIVIDDRRRALTSIGFNYKTRVNVIQNFDGNDFINDADLIHSQQSFAFASDILEGNSFTQMLADLEGGIVDTTLPSKKPNRRRSRQYLIQTQGSNINIPGGA